jgi:N-acyl-D-aspartate/D-glutamate deacylase
MKDRGMLTPGSYADIAILDFEKLKIVGIPEESRNYPEGTSYVIVNGNVVVDSGKHTGARPGRILAK